MTIATATQSYDSDLLYQLDQIKDMPSREETDRQQKMKDMESTMPPDMRGPPPDATTTPQEEQQLHEQPNKDNNDPYTWGMGPSMDRTGPAMVPYPTPKFQHIMGALDEIISPQQIQAGPNNKDTTPAQDNRPDLYIDENGSQRSRKNDEILSPHSSFVDKMAKGLSSSDAQLIEKYYQGYESTHGKWTDEDQKRLQPFQDAVEAEIGHLPGHTSTFAPNGQETIEMHNWDSLLMDKVLKQYKMLNPGRRSEDDTLPANARPTQAEIQNPDKLAEAAGMVKDYIAEKFADYSEPFQKIVNAIEKEGPPPSDASYDKVVQQLEKASEYMNPSFIPTAEQFKNAPWKEKLGFMLSTSLMMLRPTPGKVGGDSMGIKPGSLFEKLPGDPEALNFWKENIQSLDKIEQPIINTLRQAKEAGSEVAGKLLDTYKKIDDPLVKAEFSRMVKNKIASATEGGEYPVKTDISQPEIRGSDPTWTNHDVKALEEWAGKGMKLKDMPDKLADRSYDASRQMARTLDLYREPKSWSPEMENDLIKWSREGGERPESLADKSNELIQSKLTSLRKTTAGDLPSPLSKKTVWDNPDNVDLLKKRISEGKSYTDIASELGVTKNTIAGKADRLGIGMDNSAEQSAKFHRENPGASNFNAYHQKRGTAKFPVK